MEKLDEERVSERETYKMERKNDQKRKEKLE